VICRPLLAEVRRELARAADPVRAPAMQAYMKSAMPFRGVAGPAQARICTAVFSRHPLPDFDAWRDTALALWRGATYREERYAALMLTGARRYQAFQRLETIPMYEELIVTGAWWDFVDLIASRRIGPLLAAHPRPLSALMRRWSRDRNMWKRRTAILCQLSFKHDTDARLLFACIEPNLGDREFFIRKAIGWALRQYARTSPETVRAYVRSRGDRLSALSRREAMKHLAR
jgi:3-methyladenine DNA glycosylase AlkD